MAAIFKLLLALATAIQCVWAELALSATVPAVIRNEETTDIGLALTGPLGDAVVSEVRTVLKTPGKRRNKPFANFTHEAPQALQDSGALVLNLRPVYSLPTKTYLVSYSVLVDLGAEEEPVWVDSDEVEVRVADPAVSPVAFVAGLAVLAASLVGIAFAAFHMTTPGWWEAVLPRQLHFILPKAAAKKRA